MKDYPVTVIFKKTILERANLFMLPDTSMVKPLTAVFTLLVSFSSRSTSPGQHIIPSTPQNLDMSAVPLNDLEPDHNEILSAVAGADRLCRVEERVDVNEREHLYRPLMELVEQGDVAIFPMGEYVQIRDER